MSLSEIAKLDNKRRIMENLARRLLDKMELTDWKIEWGCDTECNKKGC